MAEEVNVETKLVKDVGPVEDVVIPVALPVPKPTSVNSRRLSTGAVGTRAGNKPQVKSRYRGDHHVISIHDHCKHGTHVKRCDHDDVVKPWKIVRRKSVEASETVKAETSGLRKKSLASTKPESSVAAKRDAVPVKKTPLTGSDVVKKVPSLGNEKSGYVMKKVSRISDAEGSKVSAPKNKEKAKTQTISGEDVKEKTVCVVEASVKGVQSGDTELEADQTLEKKMRSKRMSSVKVNPANQLSFKKGKTLELRHEDSSPKWIKFRKKVVQEMKPQTEGRKKKLKGIETRSDSCEGSKREKVVLRHQKVEGKKKMMTLFNNVIEETMNKLTKVRKTKVKALIGAFETVISLQDTKTPQSKDTTFSSKV